MSQRYDVIIIGGGMVGSALACALGRHGWRIALVEANAPATTWSADNVDLRVSAITAASQRLFQSLGVWDSIVAMRVSPFREMHVWDAGGNGEIHFDSADIGEDRLGHIIENRVIQLALQERIAQCESIDVLCPARLSSLSIEQSHAVARLEDGQLIEAALIVGADGGQSRVRGLAGIDVRGWSYGQKGLVTNVMTAQAHRETAWQRFLPTGPLAFLPLENGQCSIVWSTTEAEADRLLQLPDDAFCSELAEAFDHRLGDILSCGPRGAFPLRLQHATAYVKSRIALIGDAAHTIHPLAGQGVNLGFMDAAALAEVLVEARASRRDIGTFGVLRRYERWRKGDNLLTMGLMDGFKRLFGNTSGPLSWLRNRGLMVTNNIGPLKNQIMLHALGEKGDLPRLARHPG